MEYVKIKILKAEVKNGQVSHLNLSTSHFRPRKTQQWTRTTLVILLFVELMM